MKIQTNNLTGCALDWAVAKAAGVRVHVGFREVLYTPPGKRTLYRYTPSTNWKQGGPIIDREGIGIIKGNPLYFPRGNERGDFYEPLWIAGGKHGQTPLIAAMRCYVASKLGDAVDVPDSLV